MSTNAFIAKKTKIGYVSIYSQWDGGPKKPGVGWNLKKFYKTPEKVDKLIALGDISSLGMTPERTVAYHRDKGEAWSHIKPRIHHTLHGLRKSAREVFASYLYIYSNGKWKTHDLTKIRTKIGNGGVTAVFLKSKEDGHMIGHIRRIRYFNTQHKMYVNVGGVKRYPKQYTVPLKQKGARVYPEILVLSKNQLKKVRGINLGPFKKLDGEIMKYLNKRRPN